MIKINGRQIDPPAQCSECGEALIETAEWQGISISIDGSDTAKVEIRCSSCDHVNTQSNPLP